MSFLIVDVPAKWAGRVKKIKNEENAYDSCQSFKSFQSEFGKLDAENRR